MKRARFASVSRTVISIILLLTFALSIPALAQSVACQVTRNCRVFATADTNGRVLGTLNKGAKVAVTKVSGQWAQIKKDGKTGFVPKVFLKRIPSGDTPAISATVSQIQQRLCEKGYLSKAAVTGKMNGATSKAIRIFQMMNWLAVSGRANDSTVRRLMSSSARHRAQVNGESWNKCGINSDFKRGGTASLIDMATGARMAIRRVGGHEHLDVEPKTAADTAILKRLYGGTFSWDSRAILLIAGGHYYAAAMNGMPHGAQINHNNNYNGQFCIHLKNCVCHGSGKQNVYHQANIRKVIAYFE